MGLFLHGPGSRGLGDLPICCFPERLMFNTVCTARQRSPAGDLTIPHSTEGTKRPRGGGGGRGGMLPAFSSTSRTPVHAISEHVHSGAARPLALLKLLRLSRWIWSCFFQPNQRRGTPAQTFTMSRTPRPVHHTFPLAWISPALLLLHLEV